jgi:hypothetical protein
MLGIRVDEGLFAAFVDVVQLINFLFALSSLTRNIG